MVCSCHTPSVHWLTHIALNKTHNCKNLLHAGPLNELFGVNIYITYTDNPTKLARITAWPPPGQPLPESGCHQRQHQDQRNKVKICCQTYLFLFFSRSSTAWIGTERERNDLIWVLHIESVTNWGEQTYTYNMYISCKSSAKWKNPKKSLLQLHTRKDGTVKWTTFVVLHSTYHKQKIINKDVKTAPGDNDTLLYCFGVL